MDLADEVIFDCADRDESILREVPSELRERISGTRSGGLFFMGALHLRGACGMPPWHSLRRYWTGDRALSRRFVRVLQDDVPFAQNCVGDQVLWRDGVVVLLDGETGQTQPLNDNLAEFFVSLNSRPPWLCLDVLERFSAGGERLGPGNLLMVYPPRASIEGANGPASIRAISADAQLDYLAGLAHKLGKLPPGTKFRLKTR
jgi:hypothetical protein